MRSCPANRGGKVSNRAEQILKWQKDFAAAPVIYYTTTHVDGHEEDTGNHYDTREAAEQEVEFRQTAQTQD